MRSLTLLLFLSVPLVAETPDPQTGTPGVQPRPLTTPGAEGSPRELEPQARAPGALAGAVGHFHARELEAAEALLLEVRQAGPENAEAAYYLGRVYLAQGRSRAAVEAIERATRLEPESSVYQFWLAEALVARIDEVAVLFKLGVAHRMRAAYEKAVALDPEYLEARVAVARYHAQAPAIAGGDPAMVERQLREIRRRDPALAHVTRALIHEQLGRPEPAQQEFETAVAVAPESVVAWREAGLFYQRRQRWQDAQRAFDEVLARQPADPVALYQAASTAITISRRQLARAEDALADYMVLAPGPGPVVLGEGDPPRRAQARERLAWVYGCQGRPQLAREVAGVAGDRGDVPPVDAALVD